jgi:hypothetical protein
MLVTYLMVPSAQLDVRASPPVMPSLSEVQAGEVWVTLTGRGTACLGDNTMPAKPVTRSWLGVTAPTD